MNQADIHSELFSESLNVVPGGVHSPVRSFKGLDMPPRFFKKADGAFIEDVQGKDYIDFCMSFGPLILGHKNKAVKEAATQALENGWSYGACEPYSLELAKEILKKISFVEKIRFLNSGTEAVMTAIRLARGHTKRNKILKFNGCYHGHVDSMLIKAGSGLAGATTSSSAGIPEGVCEDTLIAELDDIEAVKKIFSDHQNQIAAVLIEPLPANNGLMPQSQEFLEFLREITKENQTLLVFDEVISGFRVSVGGMAQVTGITPDIVTYGKIIGGGFPVGALAAKAEIMDTLAPVGDVYQAGTLSANPLAMVAGLANLKALTEDTYTKIENSTKEIIQILETWFQEYENGKFSHLKVTQTSSLFWISSRTNLKKAIDIPSDQGENFKPLFETLLEKGIYLAPNAYEVGFVSLAHNDEVIQEFKRRLYS
ncbi:MAG: glutamate-1-semialdehyde 2,1-aminomutase [Bacteriovoracaceae bacterium]